MGDVGSALAGCVHDAALAAHRPSAARWEDKPMNASERESSVGDAALRLVAELERPPILPYATPVPKRGPFRRASSALLNALGGWRRIFFALGFGTLLGYFGYGFSRYDHETTGMGMFFGGLVVGIAIRAESFRRHDDAAAHEWERAAGR
jgi:hypothetical protein